MPDSHNLVNIVFSDFEIVGGSACYGLSLEIDVPVKGDMFRCYFQVVGLRGWV
jgi:hypothetical protein